MNQTSSDVLNSAFQALNPFIVFFFIMGLATFIIAIAYIIRVWLVQTAAFQMQKDIAEIKEWLLKDVTRSTVSEVANVTGSKNVQSEVEIVQKKFELKKPRPAFMWVALAIPVLLIVLIVIQNIH